MRCLARPDPLSANGCQICSCQALGLELMRTARPILLDLAGRADLVDAAAGGPIGSMRRLPDAERGPGRCRADPPMATWPAAGADTRRRGLTSGCAPHLVRRWPDLPLAAVTGYAEDLTDLVSGTPDCPLLILSKPVQIQQLRQGPATPGARARRGARGVKPGAGKRRRWAGSTLAVKDEEGDLACLLRNR